MISTAHLPIDNNNEILRQLLIKLKNVSKRSPNQSSVK